MKPVGSKSSGANSLASLGNGSICRCLPDARQERARRSFYPLTAADVLGSNVGDSVKRVSQIFARAKENSPSLIFIDEMDSLLPRATGLVGQHDIQVTEQFMIAISDLQPEQNVFLVGTTNHADHIDPRILRGGRFSEKIEIGLPGRANRAP